MARAGTDRLFMVERKDRNVKSIIRKRNEILKKIYIEKLEADPEKTDYMIGKEIAEENEGIITIASVVGAITRKEWRKEWILSQPAHTEQLSARKWI